MKPSRVQFTATLSESVRALKAGDYGKAVSKVEEVLASHANGRVSIVAKLLGDAVDFLHSGRPDEAGAMIGAAIWAIENDIS